MTEKKRYFITVISPDGSSTDIVLTGVHTSKLAKWWLAKYQKLYPDCRVELL